MTQPLYPVCLKCRERFAKCRGLCSRCYDRAGRAVRCGETTWAALEAEGQVLPAETRGSGWRRHRLAR